MTSILSQRRLSTLLAVEYCRNMLMPQGQSLFFMLAQQLENSPMKKELQEIKCMEIYLNAIDSLDRDFCSYDAISFFRSAFRKKSQQLTPDNLYRYFQDA
jgi:hypothetical protein